MIVIYLQSNFEPLIDDNEDGLYCPVFFSTL